MESVDNIVERVDRLTALVETAVMNHAGDAAELVARGMQIRAEATLETWWWGFVALGVVLCLLAAGMILGAKIDCEVCFGFTFVLAVFVLIGSIIAGLSFVGHYPDLRLRATDPVAAIAREAVMR